MKKESWICDFCQSGGYKLETMSKLQLTMSEGYRQNNSLKGTLISPNDWDLCPLCFEAITQAIKDLTKGLDE